MKKEILQEVFESIESLMWKLWESGDERNISSSTVEWVMQSIKHTLLYTESPIEKKFLLALIAEIVKKNNGENLFQNPINIWTNEIEDLFPEEYFEADKIVMLFINPSIGKYRPDIVVENKNNKVIFEIDGFEFHNTKQQLVSDKKRERELSTLGYKIYRFSGSEIYQDTQKVAKEALDIIYREFKI